MKSKQSARLRRASRSRIKMRELGVARLTVHRSSKHIYAQVIDGSGARVLAQASTLDSSLKDGSTGNKEAATKVGELIANRAQEAGIKTIAFDRSGYKYHGRVKCLADAARDKGLEF